MNTAGTDTDISSALTVQEAARELGCTQAALYQAVKQGRLAHVRILGRIGVTREGLKEYAARFGQGNGWNTRHGRA